MRHLLLLAALLLAGCDTRPEFVPRYFSPTDAGIPVLIPLEPGVSDSAELVGRVCRPDVPGRLPVVVINHGSPSNYALKDRMEPTGCDTEAAQWFTDRGYLVVFALRRGFGRSTGPVVEDTTHRSRDGTGVCYHPNYFRSGLFGAQDIDAILRFATTLPYARPDNAIVIGQSTGGWATIAYDSVEHPLARVFINFAGGRGAHDDADPTTICRPDLLVAAAKRYGESAQLPMLWVYAQNDGFFPQPVATQLHLAFTRAGGRAQLVFTPPFGNDGHFLFYGSGGSDVWGPIVERFIAEQTRP